MTLDIDRETFVDRATADGPVSVRAVAELSADVEPLAAYAALTGRTADGAPGKGGHTFLLESAEKVASSDPDGAFAPATDDRHARYSFVGYDADAVITVDDETSVEVFDDRIADLVTTDGGDVLDDLRAAMPDVELRGFPDHDRQHLDGGLVGFLAYDAVYDLWLDEVGLDRPDSRFPDAQFALTTTTLRFDHVEETAALVFTPIVRPGEDPRARYDALLDEVERVEAVLDGATDLETGSFVPAHEEAGPRDEYEDAVEHAKESVLSGDIYQGVISRKRELYGEMDPLALYESLRAVNPSPYMYLLDYDGLSIVGASPETLVSVADDRIVSNPIAGTCPRGTSPVEDRRLAGEMLADDKERAEHTMLVDLARNDVRRVAEPGSVRVEEFMNVLKYSHVQHIESTVTGTLDEGADAFDAARATFPAGTLSGAPKIRAMEIIDELERSPRGVYGGGVGYFSWTGDTDFAIVIRSATVEDCDTPAGVDGDRTQRTTVQAGAGIVADSVPGSEYEETENKMGGVLDAVERIRAPAADANEEVSR
ncbi:MULTISPECIES: anthranilate synthase component I [Halomicrobium]|uniref:Anthranilate synthase component 1 n=2 Tax=Halomicrobium mukohataei TaxID=57705 RepID=C7P461_HALMD|nr:MULTISPECIES: anthranilate synthase component I [Halomicrobium]ACV47883.1 anthranilate synthase component I [Halomicrobium mukohataei DSM 12286]QCD66323.1 anthranilate synthase component I [Halomicrobium mukohataei]QFR21129.1 anthranilate synthase component I [Halomicrobium sp. ZPS1]